MRVDHVRQMHLVRLWSLVVVDRNDAAHGDSTINSQIAHSCLEVHASHVLEIHIDSTWGGFLHSLSKLLGILALFVIHAIVKAEVLFDQTAFLWPSSGSNHSALEDILRKHPHHGTYCSSSSTHPNRFAFVWPQDVNQATIRSGPWHSKSTDSKADLILSHPRRQLPKPHALQGCRADSLKVTVRQVGAEQSTRFPIWHRGFQDFPADKAIQRLPSLITTTGLQTRAHVWVDAHR
mmetsp:Transcript_8226/g.18396  ORF Transcript_8226/g.18396 Transcript_8226/m.18396 type:complete len:235 (+) Transcript_8226:251-955(+)